MNEIKEAEGPAHAYRESALIRLQRRADQLKRRLAGVEALIKIAERLEAGSPLEELLWEVSLELRQERNPVL